MVREAAMLHIKEGLEQEFEDAFRQARRLFPA
ncbi:hypothetical protein BJQ93_00198 [Bacillus subtilis]|nr:hypothetical protein [Bacillus subtilis]